MTDTSLAMAKHCQHKASTNLARMEGNLAVGIDASDRNLTLQPRLPPCIS